MQTGTHAVPVGEQPRQSNAGRSGGGSSGRALLPRAEAQSAGGGPASAQAQDPDRDGSPVGKLGARVHRQAMQQSFRQPASGPAAGQQEPGGLGAGMAQGGDAAGPASANSGEVPAPAAGAGDPNAHHFARERRFRSLNVDLDAKIAETCRNDSVVWVSRGQRGNAGGWHKQEVYELLRLNNRSGLKGSYVNIERFDAEHRRLLINRTQVCG